MSEINEFTSVDDALADIAPGANISRSSRVGGGDINDAYSITLSNGMKVFIKKNTPGNKDFFRAEIDGVTAIRSTGTVRCPKLLAWGTDSSDCCSYLIMEMIESVPRNKDYYERLGVELANMHRADVSGIIGTGKYGFTSDNYIGAGYQENTVSESFIVFFRDHRLLPQIRRAESYFDISFQKKINHLLDRIPEILIEPESPSLLHGDLWGGNIIAGPDGSAWLIDPAVYIGHREADLAMTELFGGFGREFYSSYKEAYPLQPGYDDRRDLYNLYHMLNHLNLFGGSYLSSVQRIVNRYT